MSNRIKSLVSLAVALCLFFAFAPNAFAQQTFTSNCVITKIGNPQGGPNLPPECASPVGPDGIIYPPGMVEHPTRPGYFQFPLPTDGSYRFEAPSCRGQHWGSKELIGVLYTVAQRWKQQYPEGRLNIGDLNATGHKSHNWGRAVDMDATTNGRDWVGDYTKGNYNREATIELGKKFADTNLILNIWYMDQAVNNAVLAHARGTNRSSGMVMKSVAAHDNHFHVDINLKPLLPYWVPGC